MRELIFGLGLFVVACGGSDSGWDPNGSNMAITPAPYGCAVQGEGEMSPDCMDPTHSVILYCGEPTVPPTTACIDAKDQTKYGRIWCCDPNAL